jgi:hypothetical protein
MSGKILFLRPLFLLTCFGFKLRIAADSGGGSFFQRDSPSPPPWRTVARIILSFCLIELQSSKKASLELITIRSGLIVSRNDLAEEWKMVGAVRFEPSKGFFGTVTTTFVLPA